MSKEVKIAGAVSVFFLIATIFITLGYIVTPPVKNAGGTGALLDADMYPDGLYAGSLQDWSTGDESPQNVSEEKEYILKNWDGLVAVFESGGTRPLRITDIPVATLRTADAEALESGIPVTGDKQLAMLLEDLSS